MKFQNAPVWIIALMIFGFSACSHSLLKHTEDGKERGTGAPSGESEDVGVGEVIGTPADNAAAGAVLDDSKDIGIGVQIEEKLEEEEDIK